MRQRKGWAAAFTKFLRMNPHSHTLTLDAPFKMLAIHLQKFCAVSMPF